MDEPTTLREAIESAVEAESSTPEPTLEPTIEASTPEPSSSEPEPSLEPAAEPAAEGKQRDDKGRFSRKEAAAEAPQAAPQGITPGPKAEPRGQAPASRAPASWRPDTREYWAALPPAVQQEISRRETEMQRTLQETAEARKFAEQLNRVVAPYEAFIRAEGSTALGAVENLMATAARLRTGTAPELANLVAGMIKQFGVGRFGQGFIEQLDSALVGEIPRVDQQTQQMQQVLQQQLAPVQQFMSQFQQAQQAQQQRLAQEAAGEVQTFLDRAEFGEDVREEMADLLEVAQRRGRELTLQDAYRQACLANPRVRTVLEQRAKTKGAQQLTSAAQRAKGAAVSVSGAPALAAPSTPPSDVRSAIEAAIAANSR